MPTVQTILLLQANDVCLNWARLCTSQSRRSDKENISHIDRHERSHDSHSRLLQNYDMPCITGRPNHCSLQSYCTCFLADWCTNTVLLVGGPDAWHFRKRDAINRTTWCTMVRHAEQHSVTWCNVLHDDEDDISCTCTSGDFTQAVYRPCMRV